MHLVRSALWDGLAYDPISGKLYREKARSASYLGEIGSLCSKGYLVVTYNKVQYKVTRIIYGIMTNEKLSDSLYTDHINGITADNRWSNLRFVPPRVNNQNRIEHRNGKPVGTSMKNGRYVALIHNGVKNVYLGSFPSEAAAGKAYERAYAKFLLGELDTVRAGGPGTRKAVINGDGEVFNSAMEAAKYTGLLRTAITNCCGKGKGTCGGVAWNYLDTDPNYDVYEDRY